ncbi:Cytochrome c/b562 domain-containing protein [Dioscorea alata]|uniref:Cytochrome c/b562 domain-containing protein n=1 Tax=Dioscorea alata TaxID=55571 RepID=A0ACB7WLG8_DIOAL|nr:Cytochrome c/b562 domain-containing protein [Dioscorea alata]
MPRRKTNTNVNDGNALCVWNFIMDDALIDAYLHQQTMGNRVGGTFTTHALDNIVNELKGKFPEKTIDKEKAQNQMKNIKRVFTRCYDIFKNGMSGFAWNPTKEMWDAEPEVWKHLIEAKPEAVEWMNKSIRNYEKLVQLYGQDRATGQHAETASKMRQRRRQNSMNLSGGSSTGAIDDIDFMVSQNTTNLENLGDNEDIEIQDDELGDEASPEVPSSSRSKKVRRSYSCDDDSKFSTAVETMSNAFVQSTTAIVEVSKNVLNVTNNILSTFGQNTNSIGASDVWVMLVNLGFSQHFLNKACLFLINDHKMLEGIMGCPDEHRKSLLLTSMVAKPRGIFI